MQSSGFGRRLRRLEKVIGFVAFMTLLIAASSRGGTNSWIKLTSGNWEETNAWSLMNLPGAGQSVEITNAGAKTVTISAATARGYPDSLTVSDLTIANANTLFLDNSETNVPFLVTGI